jgi:hypothetical protein
VSRFKQGGPKFMQGAAPCISNVGEKIMFFKVIIFVVIVNIINPVIEPIIYIIPTLSYCIGKVLYKKAIYYYLKEI